MQNAFPVIIRTIVFFSGYTALTILIAPGSPTRILVSSLIATAVFLVLFEVLLRYWRRV
jgi:hypothetical protein